MKRRLILAVFLCLSFRGAGLAEAGWAHTAICDFLETTATYWAVYGAIEGLKASGGLTSEMECLDLGDTVGDVGIPTGTYKDCACEAVGWPAANPPVCSDPHNACTTGVNLAVSSAMMGCATTPTEDVAGKVCASDSYCCTTQWDSVCVSEASGAFWSALDAQVETIVDRMDLTCDQKDQRVASLQVEANTDYAQMPCLGTKTYPSSCGDRQYFEFIVNGQCMGVAAGNMTNGTNIVPWSCNANVSNGYTQAKDQAWTVDLNDCFHGYWSSVLYCSVHNAMNYNKCLGTRAGATGNNTNLVIWDCLGIGHPDQYWDVTQQSDGNYYLTNLASASVRGGDLWAFGVYKNSSTFNLSTRAPSSEFPVTP
jgi:hypothetical protein